MVWPTPSIDKNCISSPTFLITPLVEAGDLDRCAKATIGSDVIRSLSSFASWNHRQRVDVPGNSSSRSHASFLSSASKACFLESNVGSCVFDKGGPLPSSGGGWIYAVESRSLRAPIEGEESMSPPCCAGAKEKDRGDARDEGVLD